MGLPGTFVGNAGEPAFAKIKRATDEFIDAVEQILRERGIARGFVRVLAPQTSISLPTFSQSILCTLIHQLVASQLLTSPTLRSRIC